MEIRRKDAAARANGGYSAVPAPDSPSVCTPGIVLACTSTIQPRASTMPRSALISMWSRYLLARPYPEAVTGALCSQQPLAHLRGASDSSAIASTTAPCGSAISQSGPARNFSAEAASSTTEADTAQTSTSSVQQAVEKPDYKQIRARIFGEPIRPTERTGRRVLARKLIGAELANWYYVPGRMPGGFNEEQE